VSVAAGRSPAQAKAGSRARRGDDSDRAGAKGWGRNRAVPKRADPKRADAKRADSKRAAQQSGGKTGGTKRAGQQVRLGRARARRQEPQDRSVAERRTGSRDTAFSGAFRPRVEARSRTGISSRTRPGVRPIVPVTGGILWGVAFIGAVATNSALAAILLMPVSVIAAISTAQAATSSSGRGRSKSAQARQSAVARVRFVVGGAAGILPLAALGGPVTAGAALAIAGGIAAIVGVSAVVATTARPTRPAITMLVAAFGPGVAAGSVVLARHQGANEAIALVVSVLAYDVGAFVMGHARTAVGGPIGVVGGLLSVAVVAVFVAAALDPPFSGNKPWILFGLVAGLAPLGVALASGATRAARLPALRRLDSLMLAGPAWVIGVTLILHR
jgi:hypothetical protein